MEGSRGREGGVSIQCVLCHTRTASESEEEPHDCCGTPLGFSPGISTGVTLVAMPTSSQSEESCMAAIPMRGCACVKLYSSSTALTG